MTDSEKNMIKALKALNELVGKGWDYAEALEVLAKDYGVDEDALDKAHFNS